jgi:phosphoglycerate dehydrogenase-like enzyme
MKQQSAFLAPESNIDYVYGHGRRQKVAERTCLVVPEPIEPKDFNDRIGELANVEILFSTWGIPTFTPQQVESLPNLKAVFYAAGSVKHFAKPLLERGIIVVSAWRANAIAVAHFTLGQILLSTKGFFRNIQEYDGSQSTYDSAFRGAGNYGSTIAVLGAGAIGRQVIELLRPFDANVIVYDPFMPPSLALALDVEQVSLEEAFARGYVITNHLADNPETKGLITGKLLQSMPPNATFINTGRGKTVDPSGLFDLLNNRPDVTALLDVTDPEPPGTDSPLFHLPNAIVSSHIAGAINDEVLRMSDLCINEYDRYRTGQPLRHSVSIEALVCMA